MTALPLFPLGAVLLPAGRMGLQVFEPRYLDLVSRSLREDSEFGVVWIRDGHEVARAEDPMPRLAPLGTGARIVDWSGLDSGRLGITVEGTRRFRLLGTRQQRDFLVIGDVEWLPEDETLPLPEEARELPGLLRQLMAHPMIERLGLVPAGDDVGAVCHQLVQLLPIAESEKYALLAESLPLRRLERLMQVLEQFLQ